jgi:hypothetical protein
LAVRDMIADLVHNCSTVIEFVESKRRTFFLTFMQVKTTGAQKESLIAEITNMINLGTLCSQLALESSFHFFGATCTLSKEPAFYQEAMTAGIDNIIEVGLLGAARACLGLCVRSSYDVL